MFPRRDHVPSCTIPTNVRKSGQQPYAAFIHTYTMSAEDASGGDKAPASAPAPKPAAATFSSFINSELPQVCPLSMLSRGQKTRQARNLHPKPHDGDLAPLLLLLLLPQPPRLLLRQRHRRRLPNRKLHRLNSRPRMRPSLKLRMSYSCPHQLPPRNPQQRLLLNPPRVQPNPQQRFHSQPRPRPPPNPSPPQCLQVQRLRHKQLVSLTLLYRPRQTQVSPLNTWRMREAMVGHLRDVA